eukprot:1771789-Amphidinium_carterae.1
MNASTLQWSMQSKPNQFRKLPKVVAASSGSRTRPSRGVGSIQQPTQKLLKRGFAKGTEQLHKKHQVQPSSPKGP